MSTDPFYSLFTLDPLAGVMMTLVGALAIIIGLFARKYLEGDSQYVRFFLFLTCAALSVMCMVSVDDLLALLAAWAISNYLLIRLMVHKSQWQAAANAGWVAGNNFMIGFSCLATAFVCLYVCTGSTSIHVILQTINPTNRLTFIATLLITLAAMSQSAIWPFHRWLLSSLNSPTPVSAIMHAGFINGGGFLMARFAPLYFAQPGFLSTLFFFGIFTALIGSLWKLMQSDIKRMLACSTMAQMGFMFAQCGLGLFAAAIVHLCWHGFFKANLFLLSNSAQQDKRIKSDQSPKIAQLMLAALGGAYAVFIFLQTSHQTWQPHDTTLILNCIVFITACQLSLNLIQNLSLTKLAFTVIILSVVFGSYGCSIRGIEYVLSPLQLMQPQPLHAGHIVFLIIAIIMWVGMLFKEHIEAKPIIKKLMAWVYVKSLNASQPHKSTITSVRSQYRY
jgi:NAD(P)H-quinone oxidoreductase subunit 5